MKSFEVHHALTSMYISSYWLGHDDLGVPKNRKKRVLLEVKISPVQIHEDIQESQESLLTQLR